MKKFVIIIISAGILLIASWIYIRVSGIFQSFSITSSSNEPTLKVGQLIFASKLKEPKRFDFITFKKQGVIIVYRLLGLPGDTIQLKDGIIFINHKELKEPFPTKHQYIIGETKYAELISDGTLKKTDLLPSSNDTAYSFDLEDKIAEAYGIAQNRVIRKAGERDEQIGTKWSNDYNTDNFGPVIVPSNSFFVLGDNRHNAADSRYDGFVSKQDFVSTVFQF